MVLITSAVARQQIPNPLFGPEPKDTGETRVPNGLSRDLRLQAEAAGLARYAEIPAHMS
jgi:hypothetical protein